MRYGDKMRGRHVSFFDLFSIGIGPSSSHTVGPMRAAKQFAEDLRTEKKLGKLEMLRVSLYGSLALTGEGHGTPKALVLGLQGYLPENAPIDQVPSIMKGIEQAKSLDILGKTKTISFDLSRDVILEKTKLLPFHPNGMRFMAFDRSGDLLKSRECFSIGGGFIVDEGEDSMVVDKEIPYPFRSGDELLEMCSKHNLSIDQIVLANELAHRTEVEIDEQIRKIWNTMNASIKAGINSRETHLPGILNVPRRARKMSQALDKGAASSDREEYLSLYAIAVNEENAAGKRVVTAPTNGAAGTIPAVLRYYLDFLKPAGTDEFTEVKRFLLTCTAIGSLYKKGASISAAEVGCQGEIGVASSMAAAGLASLLLGATPWKVENAAEIAMEHSLGMTCDPIGGLVQIPCIERNAVGAGKAVLAARLAGRGDGRHHVSLDTVIETMRQTGMDMHSKYKETSQGGLAANHPLC